MSSNALQPLPDRKEIESLPDDGGPEFNRLIHENSPYLRQHARNPVDWYPWGEEARRRAATEDLPIFLSVGYSTCHWCHVMEHDSFERDDVAEILNAHYVAVKVDREERPDLDEIYMNATQLLTRHGGWPNSVWLTPDGHPWYAGTYFPREDRGGRPGFKTLLRQLSDMWRNRRDEVESQASRITEALRDFTLRKPSASPPQLDQTLVDAALRELRLTFDEVEGGFGDAPKFPPHGSLRLLFHEFRRTGDPTLLDMATRTLDAMEEGGIHDHVGGGFHRYSTDAKWLLPHFEKMLYDNAQLGRAYVDAFLLTSEDRYRDVAQRLYAWVLREMTDAGGGFYSALDADSEGEEGKFYVWKRSEVLEHLGDDEGGFFCDRYNIVDEGNFSDEASGQRPGTNIPHLEGSIEELARADRSPPGGWAKRLADSRERLLAVRGRRVWPHLDDKILTSWNGLMIGSLAYAGRNLEEPRYVAAAERAAEFVLGHLARDGRLLRSYRDGTAHLNAYLDDYAFFADGLLDLHEATSKTVYLESARRQLETLLAHYRGERGGFFFTADDHEELLFRSQDPFDRALPSGNGVATLVLLRLAADLRDEGLRSTAREVLEAFGESMLRSPRGTEALILSVATYLRGVRELGGEGSADSPLEWGDAEGAAGPVWVRAYASQLHVAPGESVEVALLLSIDDGWTVAAPDAGGDPALTVRLAPGSGLELVDAVYAPGVDRVFGEAEPIRVYEGSTIVRAKVRAPAEMPVGCVGITLEVRFQACSTDRCAAPESLTLVLPVRVSAERTVCAVRYPSLFKGGASESSRP